MGNEEQDSAHRTLNTSVSILIEHLEGKLEMLPVWRAMHSLSDEVIEGLREHIQAEIDFLRGVPPEVTLQILQDNCFNQNAILRNKIIENSSEGLAK